VENLITAIIFSFHRQFSPIKKEGCYQILKTLENITPKKMCRY